MQTITISASKLAELLGVDAGQGIFDITMNAWDSPECMINVEVCDNEKLVASGLH